jgi:uncharacterized protein YjbI with pentapeptide repeats
MLRTLEAQTYNMSIKHYFSAFILLFYAHIATAQLQEPVAPGRPDNLNQAQVDQLLAQSAMNFDGFRFDNKRFDFINFEKGSFRGTTFYKSTLNDGISRRKASDPDKLDFESTYFYMCKLNRVNFAHWKFLNTTFFADSITDGTFKYCPFTDVKFYSDYIGKMKFNNGSMVPFKNVQFYSCRLDGGGFDSVKMIGGAFSAKCQLSNVGFNAVEFNATNFIRHAALGVNTFNNGCRFSNVKFISATLDGAAFGTSGGTTWFENVRFENIQWNTATAYISFNGSCLFIGAATNIQSVNFATSVFNSAIFGEKNAPYKMPVRRCNFASCTFNGPVIFYNCNFENTTFPAEAVLKAAGVKFIDCLFAPYNS